MDLFVADDNGANDMWQRLVPPDRIEGENIAADDAIREDCEAKDPSFFTVNQTLMEKSMKELEEHIHFYGINEQGCEVDIAYQHVPFIRYLNKRSDTYKMLPFFVMSPAYAAICEEEQNNPWKSYSLLELEPALALMRGYACKHQKRVTFSWPMLSYANKTRHCTLCTWTTGGDPSDNKCKEDKTATFWCAVGDADRCTVQGYLPVNDEEVKNAANQNVVIPLFRKAIKLQRKAEFGSAINIQEFLKKAGFSDTVCLLYVVYAQLRVMMMVLWGETSVEPTDPQKILESPLWYASVHNEFLRKLVSGVKYTISKYIAALGSNSAPIDAVVFHLTGKYKEPAFHQITSFSLEGGLQFNMKKKKKTLNDHHCYILGFTGTERAKSNKKVFMDAVGEDLAMRTEEFQRTIDVLGLLEDFPCGIDLISLCNARQKSKERTWELPVSVDSLLFDAAKHSGYTIRSHQHKSGLFRVTLNKLSSAWLFVDVPKESLSPAAVSEFWKFVNNSGADPTPPTLELPTDLMVQNQNELSCVWRSQSALMGGDGVLNFEILLGFASFLAWRNFPEIGTATQLEQRDSSLFGSRTTLLLPDGVLDFYLRTVTNFRMVRVYPLSQSAKKTRKDQGEPALSDKLKDILNTKCGRFMVVGAVKNAQHNRASKLLTAALRKQAAKEAKENAAVNIYEVQSITYLGLGRDLFNVRFVGYADSSECSESDLQVSPHLTQKAKESPGEEVSVQTIKSPAIKLRLKLPKQPLTGMFCHAIPCYRDAQKYRDLMSTKWSTENNILDLFQVGQPPLKIYQLMVTIKSSEGINSLHPWCSCSLHNPKCQELINQGYLTFTKLDAAHQTRSETATSSSSSSSNSCTSVAASLSSPSTQVTS